jgi:transposase
MIISLELCDSVNDAHQLKPMVDQVKAELDSVPELVLADKGYFTFDILEEIEQSGKTQCLVPVQKNLRDHKQITFKYDEVADEYICSQGKRLKLIAKNKKKQNNSANVYRGIECDECTLRSVCTTSKKGRLLHRYHNQEWRDHYRERIQTRAVKALIKKRKTIVEHPFGTLRAWMGKTQLLLRGKSKVQIELDLYGTVYNMRRLMNMVPFTELKAMIAGYDWEMA